MERVKREVGVRYAVEKVRLKGRVVGISGIVGLDLVWRFFGGGCSRSRSV